MPRPSTNLSEWEGERISQRSKAERIGHFKAQKCEKLSDSKENVPRSEEMFPRVGATGPDAGQSGESRGEEDCSSSSEPVVERGSKPATYDNGEGQHEQPKRQSVYTYR
jgi:hypothetical protein